MNCIVCGSSLTSRQKKCSKCGAEANLSKGEFIFEFDTEDQKTIKKYYAHFEKNKSDQSYTSYGESTKRNEVSNESTSGEVSSRDLMLLEISNDAGKQYKAGEIYFKGNREVSRNYSKAFMLFHKSAKQGNSDAQLMLAKCYENGYGTGILESQALKWYRKALNGGKSEASEPIRRLERVIKLQREEREALEREQARRQIASQNYSYSYSTTNNNSEYSQASYGSSSAQIRRSVNAGSFIKDFFKTVFAFLCAIAISVIVALLVIMADSVFFDGTIKASYAVEFIGGSVFGGFLIWLYSKLFSIRYNAFGLRFERILRILLVIIPVFLVLLASGITVYVRHVPEGKYKYAEFKMSGEKYAEARELYEELGDYKDSKDKVHEIIFKYPSSLKVGDTVKFGSYEQDNNHENGKEDIEWQVLYGSSYDGYASYVTLISKNALEYKYFDANYWEYSSLRYWLNNDFLNSAFTSEQQAVLDFTGGYNTDKVDVFAIGNKAYFPVEIIHTTPTEYARSIGGENVNWCFRWTNQPQTFEYNTIQVSYVDSQGNILGDVPDGYFYVRPVIRLKIFAYENQLAYGDNHYTELYNSDFSGLLKTYTGTYVAGQGITCMDFTITSCDKYGNITADVFFYPHPGNPSVPSGRYVSKGCITAINKKDGSLSINLVGDKWINRPTDYGMLELSVTVDSQFSTITGDYQFDLKAVSK